MKFIPKRTDSNQKTIIQKLRDNGYRVISLALLGQGIPDLLVLSPTGQIFLIEVKNPKGFNRLSTQQKTLIDEGWPIIVVRNALEIDTICPLVSSIPPD